MSDQKTICFLNQINNSKQHFTVRLRILKPDSRDMYIYEVIGGTTEMAPMAMATQLLRALWPLMGLAIALFALRRIAFH